MSGVGEMPVSPVSARVCFHKVLVSKGLRRHHVVDFARVYPVSARVLTRLAHVLYFPRNPREPKTLYTARCGVPGGFNVESCQEVARNATERRITRFRAMRTRFSDSAAAGAWKAGGLTARHATQKRRDDPKAIPPLPKRNRVDFVPLFLKAQDKLAEMLPRLDGGQGD